MISKHRGVKLKDVFSLMNHKLVITLLLWRFEQLPLESLMLWFCIIYPNTFLFSPFCFLKENSIESFSVCHACSDKTMDREMWGIQAARFVQLWNFSVYFFIKLFFSFYLRILFMSCLVHERI